MILIALLAIAVIALSYEISKLRGDRGSIPATPTSAPAEQVLSPSDVDSPPADAVLYPTPARIQT